MPAFLAEALRRHRGETKPDERALIFADRDGGPQRRSNFRRRVWLPSLLWAGCWAGWPGSLNGDGW